MEPWTVIKKALPQCGSDASSCPGPYPTVAGPDFHVGCRLGKELFALYFATADAHTVMGCHQKSFIILVVWRWHQLLSRSLPNSRLSQVSRRLGRELFTLPSYLLIKSSRIRFLTLMGIIPYYARAGYFSVLCPCSVLGCLGKEMILYCTDHRSGEALHALVYGP